jgi:hypothetical protein
VFNELIYNKFQININKALTGPSLSMRVFKTHYLKPNTIYQINPLGGCKAEYDIRQSYSGGAVDVYEPHNLDLNTSQNMGPVLTLNKKGKYVVLYYYDVNSLYP